jgi:hypothetical protein
MGKLDSVTNDPNAIAHHTAIIAEGMATNGKEEVTRTTAPAAQDVPHPHPLRFLERKFQRAGCNRLRRCCTRCCTRSRPFDFAQGERRMP